MDIQGVLIIVLILVGIVAVGALAWFLVELAKTVKSAREGLDPTLGNVEKMTSELAPAMERVDPLLERVNLTVDALNLELMRVDKLLSDVGDVTATASGAASAVDNITAAPAKVVNSLTDKVHNVLNGRKASAASAQLAAVAASAGVSETAIEQPVNEPVSEPVSEPAAAEEVPSDE